MKTFLQRASLAISIALLLSCGGGGGGGGGGGDGGLSATSTQGSDGFSGGATLDGGGSGGGGGSSASSSAGSSDGGTSTASAGDSSGVGSGGTGASASAGDAGDSGDAGVGGVGGVGSIIVNGVRYDTDSALVQLQDASTLQIGMTARVIGPTNADFTLGVAQRIDSAAELRGRLSAVDLGTGRFIVAGQTVLSDDGTVWGDAAGLSAVPAGTIVQVWGLPAGPGRLRATRVEQRSTELPIVTGALEQLDPVRRSFVLGGLTIDYRAIPVAQLPGGVGDGALVRVRAAAAPAAGVLSATSIERWYPVSLRDGVRRELGGVVTDFSALGSFRLLGLPVDASAARVTGGPMASLGNGVEVEVAGTVSGGVLRAATLRIKQIPGTGGPSSFTLIGPVGRFVSVADFRVKGQPVDASGPTVTFVNGTAASLREGVSVTVTGGQVVRGVLLATRVQFD
ncbi:DUF5666 domain-containing protein [Variovorax sp. ZT4R33]|uniref:DUF5666 domain-containing protein n=1 Tax=Variovorax sp. ZT4R33 TaxID=3443743 RepID=UPI003F4568F2